MKLFPAFRQSSQIILWLALLVHASGCAQQARSGWEYKGVSLENPPKPIAATEVEHLAATGATSVAVIPYAFMRSLDGELVYNSDYQWWGERPEGCRTIIRLAHQKGMGSMVKPQVWIRGSYTGDYLPANAEAWLAWQKTYTDYIIEFAKIAEAEKAALFCIGTEFKGLTTTYPEFWRKLIGQVRSVYTGKLVYAANWDEYERVEFWDALDYVGVNAYFPLTAQKDPLLAEIITAWKPRKTQLSAISTKHQRPILLTEFGYRSADGAVWQHWDIQSNPVNLDIQRLAYTALFESLWFEPWCAGGFWWKWHFDKHRLNGNLDNDFSPQGKPAMEAIQTRYLRLK